MAGMSEQQGAQQEQQPRRRVGEPGPRPTQPLTARQWFAIAVVGAVVAVIAYGADQDGVGGIARLVAIVGAIGLVWRLLDRR